MVALLVVATASAGIAVLAFFVVRGRRHAPTWAVLTPGGYQEARVTINGSYRPDVLKVRQGVPLRIHFLREEDSSCSERVVFSHFGVDRRLPAFQETTVEFVPTTAGTFLFTCQWGMYRGKLVVSGATSSGLRGRNGGSQR